MIESKLTELLERTGDQTAVGPPPLDALRAGAARRRHRRTAAWSAVSALTVAAVIGGTTLLATQGSGDPSPPVATATPGLVPAGMRLVGLGHAAIAVPKNWGTNELTCATPKKDTVLIDVGAVTLCGMPRPVGVESLELGRGVPQVFDFHAEETLEIDGVRAERQRTTCSDEGNFLGQGTICTGAVFIPSLDVWFLAESSTNAEEVDRMLGRIVVEPDLVGVPGYRAIDRDGKQPTGEDYAPLLEQAGLKAEFRTRKSPGYPAGTIFTAVPAPGTMVAPGATVTITVAGS
ncbi:PASTA domain-containing protein [Kribbella sp. NPDC026596]|uniref:PASTA domain-containing protein n=1 Tax=Kribbella sp. NPDC026596 TaxID=3155122 RepID=UPI0033EEECA7